MKKSAVYRILLSIILWTAGITALCIITIEIGAGILIPDWNTTNIITDPDHRLRQPHWGHLNKDNLRSLHEPNNCSESDYNIMFLGDSFIYGWGVAEDKSIPARFEEISREKGIKNIVAINLGWPSSSPYLSNRLLHDIGKNYCADLVVMTVDMSDFLDDTLYRNIVENKKFFSIGKYIPATTALISWANKKYIHCEWLQQILFGVPYQRYFNMERPLDENTRPYFDALMHNLGQINQYAVKQLHAEYAVFILPRYFHYNIKESPHNWEKDQYSTPGPYSFEPFRYIAEKAPYTTYPLISLLSDFKKTKVFPTTIDDDIHFTEEGNRLAAEFIWQHLSELKLLPQVNIENTAQ